MTVEAGGSATTYVNPAPPLDTGGTGSTFNQASADGLDDCFIQAGERGKVFPAFPLHPLDHRVVLARAALPCVQAARLEDLGVVHAGERLGDLVAEIGVVCPGD